MPLSGPDSIWFRRQTDGRRNWKALPAVCLMPSPPAGARARLAAAFLNAFWPLYRSGRRRDFLPDYLARQTLPGRHVEVRPGRSDAYGATVLGVDEECRLLVQPDGGTAIVPLSSGEVQIVPAKNPIHR